jgi:metallothionein
MADEKKCAHSECRCMVSREEKYCSDYCKDAQDVGDTEIQCDCKHPPCEL